MSRSSYFFIVVFIMLVGDILKDDLFEDSVLAIIFCTAWVIESIEQNKTRTK